MKLPRSVCFRVTRACNARCGFCLAPWDGNHPREEVLAQRLEWLLENGVRAVDFCGGEPTIHPALPRLIEQVHTRGARTRLTTNGLVLPPPLLETLKCCQTHVKVSLHGEREWHDRVVGLEAFDKATATLRRLCQAGVRATVQTTLVAGGSAALPAMAGLCARLGVRRLTVMPFIPRGRGAERESEFALSAEERTELRAAVKRLRGRKLDIRWNDFSRDRAAVMEADGRLVLEGVRDAGDIVLQTIGFGGAAGDVNQMARLSR
jgi:MoaA/NifB/PqqE/SkfB family radical SAM enzyme